MTAPLPLADIPETYVQIQGARSRSNAMVLYGLVGLLVFCPLAFGAVELWAISILEVTVVSLTALWALRQVRSGTLIAAGNSIFTPMCAFCGLALIQFLPGISVYRHATVSALQLYVAYGCACFLITQTMTRTTDVRRVATVLTAFGLCIAIFAVLQSLGSNGKIYWLRTPHFGGWIYGPYVNHNHYAGLMEMLAPIPLVFAFSRYAHGRKRWIAAAAAAFMGATIFLCGSRGGMVAFSLQLALFFWFLFRQRQRTGIALVLCAFLLVAVASVAVIGGTEVSQRISTVRSNGPSELRSDIRVAIYRDCLRMFAKRPILGWGLGTFVDVYPQFRSFYTDQTVNAAHNDYLQLMSETGLLGFAAGLWFVIAAVRSAIRKCRNWSADVDGAVALAASLGITGILVHSFLDFNMQVPANALLFYVLCSVAGMNSHFRSSHREHRHRSKLETSSGATSSAS